MPTVLRLVAVPALITLLVTGVRLAGELQSWSSAWFSREAGGQGAVLGIGWLMPVFGAWFGWRLARSGAGPACPRRAVLLPLLGCALVAVTFAGVVNLMDVSFTSFALTLVALAAWSVLAWRGWPALARVDLVYALAARLPIVVLTCILVPAGLDTHYEKPHPQAPPMSDLLRTVVLCLAQLGIWIPLTLLVGGLAGGLAAAVAKRTRVDAP